KLCSSHGSLARTLTQDAPIQVNWRAAACGSRPKQPPSPLGNKETAMSNEALIVIDLQNDFCGGGALAVKHGEDIVPLVNTMIAEADHVVLTQDWHPHGHSSFASSHQGRSPYDLVDMPYGAQTLW